MQYILLVISVILLSIGQIMFKKSANLLGGLNSPFLLLLKPVFIGALVIYGLATISWIMALQSLPLSRAYMFMAVGFILIPLLSHYIFGEALTLKFICGALLIISGVLLTLKS